MSSQTERSATIRAVRRAAIVVAQILAVPAILVGGLAPAAATATPDPPDAGVVRQASPTALPPVASPTPPSDGGGALAPGTSVPTNVWRIADTGGVPARVRSAPSLDAPVVMRLEPGTVVEPLSETATADGYQWRRISVGGTTGWIVTTLLLEPPPPPRVVVYEVAAVGERGLNFRASPSTTAPIIGSLIEGTVVEPLGAPVEAEGRQWLNIRANGVTGWVIAEAIRER